MAVAPPPAGPTTPSAAALLSRVVEHYHRTFCQRKDAQEYLAKRGLTDTDLLKVFKIGYADGSLLKLLPRGGELKDQLIELGVISEEGRELLGGCVVVPIPDPVTGAWTTLYGRGMRTARHCYLPGPLRGVLNYQAARASSEVILTESVIDALSFHQAGISTAIPIYGTNGFTADHFDALKSNGVKRVILALDGDIAGRKATASLKEKLTAAGLSVSVMPYPPNVKDANELLVSCNGTAAAVFAKCLDEAQPTAEPTSAPIAAPTVEPVTSPASSAGPAKDETPGESGTVTVVRDGRTYQARVQVAQLGRLRATVRASHAAGLHVDTIDLYSARSRTEFARRASKPLGAELEAIETDLLAVLVQCEKASAEGIAKGAEEDDAPEISESDRAEALALLRRPDLLDQIAADVDALGYVGESVNTRLLYLVAVSRKLSDPLSAVILSQSGAGKSGISEVIERVTPPEDVVLVTRLTPQSLYYVEAGALDHKLILIEERHGSMEADYSVRVLQSRKKLSVMAPIKDPQTGNMKTKQFTVEARAAFIEATTASDVNHENSTRCFELTMDESADQTRRIHERQRLMWTEAGLRMREQAERLTYRHWNAQRLLEPLPVVIPYADKLTFPTAWMRTRRDHARFLNLIGVSAFLHQYQRERRGHAILAALADYAIAYQLAAQVLTDTLADVSKPLRDAYEKVRALCLEKGGIVSRRDVREALHVHDSTVRRWLSDLVDFEYLAIVGGDKTAQGRAARYQLVDREEKKGEVLGLLTPDELAGRLRSRP